MRYDLLQACRRGVHRIVLLALLGAPPLLAADDRALVGGDPNYPPFHYLNEDGQAAGRDVELVRAIARDQGLRVEFSLVEWGRTLSLLERGSVDVVPMFITEDRKRRFAFSQPFARRHHQVFGRRGAQPIDDLSDLAGERVAVQFAGMAWEWLSNQNAGVDIQPINVEDSAVLAVARGEADYALVPSDIGERAIAVHRLDDIVAIGPPVLERDYAFGVSSARPALLEKINAGIDGLRASGELDRIMGGSAPGQVPTERQQRPIRAGERARVSWWIAGGILMGLVFWVGLRWSRGPAAG